MTNYRGRNLLCNNLKSRRNFLFHFCWAMKTEIRWEKRDTVQTLKYAILVHIGTASIEGRSKKISWVSVGIRIINRKHECLLKSFSNCHQPSHFTNLYEFRLYSEPMTNVFMNQQSLKTFQAQIFYAINQVISSLDRPINLSYHWIDHPSNFFNSSQSIFINLFRDQLGLPIVIPACRQPWVIIRLSYNRPLVFICPSMSLLGTDNSMKMDGRSRVRSNF